ncbi:hypothetical protein ACFL2V_09535 [Pseudomonadota bacterium]
MKFVRFLAILVFSLFYLTPTQANQYGIKDAEKFRADIEQAREVYLKTTGENINKRDVRKAIKHMDKLSRKYKKHPLVMIYKGCSLAQRGRDIGARPLDRMRETEEGLKHVDRGLKIMARKKTDYVAKAEGHLLAAFLFVHLPDSVFHRLKEGNHLINGLLDHDRFEEFPKKMKGAIYHAAATSAEKHGKPEKQKHYLQLSLKVSPDSEEAKEIKKKLKKL